MNQCKIIAGTKRNAEEQMNKLIQQPGFNWQHISQSFGEKGIIIITVIYNIN